MVYSFFPPSRGLEDVDDGQIWDFTDGLHLQIEGVGLGSIFQELDGFLKSIPWAAL